MAAQENYEKALLFLKEKKIKHKEYKVYRDRYIREEFLLMRKKKIDPDDAHLSLSERFYLSVSSIKLAITHGRENDNRAKNPRRAGISYQPKEKVKNLVCKK